MSEIQEFAEQFLAPEKPPRDSSGRPLLVPRNVFVAPDWTPEQIDQVRVAYTRASGLGDLLEEFSYLWKWKMRGLTIGLAKSMDLVRLAAAETYTCGFAEDETENRASGRRVDQVISRALDRAGVAEKADYGTAIHARTEPGNDGVDPDEKQRVDVASCWDLWRELGVVHLGTEVFTANDELRSAGTFDHLSWVPGLGIVVTDKKTSAKAKSTYDVQLSGYAHSDVYDKETDQRLTLEEYVASLGWDPALINREVGVLWWVKNGRTEARELDLVNGYKWARVAADIRDNRRTQGVAKNVGKRIAKDLSTMRDELLTRIQNAPSVDELNQVWYRKQNQAIWTDDHTSAAKARIEAL